VLDKINGLFSGKRERKSDIPPVPQLHESQFRAMENRNDAATAHGRTPAPKMPTGKVPNVTTTQVVPRSSPPSNPAEEDTTLMDGIDLEKDLHSFVSLCRSLIEKAKIDPNPRRRDRMLKFAQVRSLIVIEGTL
jgi:hypothetical protein